MLLTIERNCTYIRSCSIMSTLHAFWILSDWNSTAWRIHLLTWYSIVVLWNVLILLKWRKNNAVKIIHRINHTDHTATG